MSEQLVALAEQSSQNDLAWMIKAKEEAKKRMKDDPSPENIRAFNGAKTAVEAEVARVRPDAPALHVCKTQLEAVSWLKNAGFKVGKSKFNTDVLRGKMPRTADGYFEHNALLGYAAACLTPLAAMADRTAGDAMTKRIHADAEFKKVQADRQKLKLEKEQGMLVAASEVERDLAARAAFFRAQIENFGHLMGPRVISAVGGDESKLPAFLALWEEGSADWMDAWSVDREFVCRTNLPEEGSE